MDSSAYRYFIRELQHKPDDSFTLLPPHFVKSDAALMPESFASLQLFIKSVICAYGSDNASLLPEILTEPRNFFSGLFIEAHKALLDVITGIGPQSHPFRQNGAHLARFLSFCASTDYTAFIAPTDTCTRAMFCFLLEGLLYAGWCADVYNGTAKRAAHSYFVSLKKSFHHLQTGPQATTLGYLWGAWLLAQKTDNTRDTPFKALPAAETFEWNIGIERQCYYARNSGTPPRICLIPYSPREIPYPVFRISCREKTGLRLYADDAPVIPEALLNASEIVRPKIAGNKFIYKCRTGAVPDLMWTVVFLFREITIYRIDVLKLPPGQRPVTIRAEMRLENEVKLEEIKKGYFKGNGMENSVIRFIQDPLGLRLEHQEDSGISVFTSGKGIFSGKEPIQLVCAWARGKGISTLNEIKLLGIFE
jgi:hypothetical protein